MSESLASLQRKIGSGADLQAVVRTMKAMAAANIGQYERAVASLDDYYRAVQLGLLVCFRSPAAGAGLPPPADCQDLTAVVLGSDQGLVGQFNEVMADFVAATLGQLPGGKAIWAVGERVSARLGEAGLAPARDFPLPSSIGAITPLVGRLLSEIEAQREQGRLAQVYLFHHRPEAGRGSAPACQRLLPLDGQWRRQVTASRWPGRNVPEVAGDVQQVLLAVVREYLFIAIFRACAESLASENASRLAAMQRAEKNIDELLESMRSEYQRLRQSGIDEELFDLIAGFEAQR